MSRSYSHRSRDTIRAAMRALLRRSAGAMVQYASDGSERAACASLSQTGVLHTPHCRGGHI